MGYVIGLDYGTNSARSLVVDTSDGRELASVVYEYESGQQGIIVDPVDHNLARQRPEEYLRGLELTIKGAVAAACAIDANFDAADVIGIGVDATGSTPLPVDDKAVALTEQEKFRDNPNAMAWLWKDHTGYAEAIEITELAEKEHPEYLAKCGGTYSSEWFFSKVLHCLRVDREVFDAAYTWLECCDFVTGTLTGETNADNIKRARCPAGHKAMFGQGWDGLPAKEFLSKLSPELGELRDRLYEQSYTIDTAAGTLSKDWADKLGLKAGIPVAVGALDAHMGAVGSGIGEGRLVKILGTSSCDMLVTGNDKKIDDIPGICGIVDGSIVPGYFGLEAGQAAVGDIFNWFVNYIKPGGEQAGSHEALTEGAAKLKPGQSGLLALDWNNGNRNILADQRLTGLLIGQTLHTRPEEIYRALIEASAFGALAIIERFAEYGAKVDEVVCCGGIAEKNPTFMQIYADVTGREMKVSRSAQTCALGSAIAAAVVGGAHETVEQAQSAMCGVKDVTYKPTAENHEVYQRLYVLYKQLHDAFGLEQYSGTLANVMKELLDIKDSVS